MSLRAPFPWFGGKSRAAHLVWPRFGDVPNYIEPFAGSLAVLLGRPADFPPRVETVNDKDAYLSNFWRAVQADPDAVAHYADWPVNETDLHARHRWLVTRGRRLAIRCTRDPEYFNPKVAGWWVWGQCLWIGSGWCARPEWTGRTNAGRRSRGIHTDQYLQRPDMTGGRGGGQGVQSPTLTRQMPRISAEGGSISGVLSDGVESIGLYEYIRALQVRLRRVRVCCGDWQRVLTKSVTTYIGVTGVLLDPPYSHAERSICYSHDEDISGAVRAWALEHGTDRKFRIALCGYEGEHEMPSSWACVPWTAGGGYGRSVRGKANRHRERIWFSPHCLPVRRDLFDAEPTEMGETA